MPCEAVNFVACESGGRCGFAADDEGADEFVFELVGRAFFFDADDCCVGDAGVFEEDTLDFSGGDLPSVSQFISKMFIRVRRRERCTP